MKAIRVRFTVRRMMVAVAAVGVVLGIYAACRARAGRFDEAARAHWLRYVAGAVLPCDGDAPRELSEPERRRLSARSEWHRLMAEKYKSAARRPWLPVEPDPPTPD